MSKPKVKDASLNKDLVQPAGQSPNPHSSRAFREFVESVVIAVILAFLFRTFEAEAFVIPTGSMAPTLQGRHMDVECPQCGYQFRVGASSENSDADVHANVISGICPICRHTMEFERSDPNERSFTGDRILVSKFSYDLFEPERWDVIVFKYPGNAKQNYIKRLVGLPGETVQIHHGDIFVRREGEKEFRIARKPPEKLEAMLQVVDDTDYWANALIQAEWPSRWQAWTPPGAAAESTWKSSFQPQDESRSIQKFSVQGAPGADAWLRYRHLIPTQRDWDRILAGHQAANPGRGSLILDFYAYNTGEQESFGYYEPPAWQREQESGLHWVGDIALECQVEVKSSQGELLLDLVEAGVHYTCRIDVSTGQATLSVDTLDGPGQFSHDDGTGAVGQVVSRRPTPLRGAGSYKLRFSNADNQLTLWVDGDPIAFNRPTTFQPPSNSRPHWTSDDPLDLAPAGIGVRGATVEATRLRILRDVYYVALTPGPPPNHDYGPSYSEDEVQTILHNPDAWATTRLFADRVSAEFEVGNDEFFPLGDNSPQSRDARIWDIDPTTGKPENVHRNLLTGKALFIYWPHHWRRPIPFTPNFQRMGFIR